MSKGTKRLVLILIFVAGLSYFAFTLVFFDPFEGSYLDSYQDTPIAIEYAVPTNVDFFVHKRALEGDFSSGDFPVPKVWDDITLARNWQEFERTPLYGELNVDLDPARRVEEVRELVAQIPLLNPLVDALGRDAAVFGRLAGRGSEQTEVAAVFLGSGKARFAYEAIGIGPLRGLLGIPVDVEQDAKGVRTLTLENGAKIHLYRHFDLFVVSSGSGLVDEVIDLLGAGRNQSLGYLRRYHATVAQDVDNFAGLQNTQVTRSEELERRVQLYGRLPSLFALTDADETFLDPKGEMSRWLLARLFNPTYFGDVTVDIGFGDTLDLRGMLSFSRERAEQAQTGFYNRNTFELRTAMDKVARLLPDDVYFAMAARLDMNRFLPTMIEALTTVNPESRKALDELVATVRRLRPDFRPTNAVDLVRSIASFIGDDVVVALKRDTYFGAPAGGMPLVALFLQVTDRGPPQEQLKSSNGDPRLNHGYNAFIHPITAVHDRLGGGVKWWIVTHGQAPPDQRSIQDLFLTDGVAIKNIAFGIIDANSQDRGPWTLAIVLSPQIASRDVNGEVKQYGSGHELISDIVQLSISGGSGVLLRDSNSGGERTREVRSLFASEAYRAGGSFLAGHASVAIFMQAGRMKDALLDSAMARLAREDLSVSDLPRARREQEQSLGWLSLFKDAFLAARIDEDSQNIELRARVRTDLDH